MFPPRRSDPAIALMTGGKDSGKAGSLEEPPIQGGAWWKGGNRVLLCMLLMVSFLLSSNCLYFRPGLGCRTWGKEENSVIAGSQAELGGPVAILEVVAETRCPSRETLALFNHVSKGRSRKQLEEN